jgi:hypothetical protein
MKILVKIFAILVMILTVVGTLLCAGLLAGGWMLSDPLTNVATDALMVVENYVGIAEQVTGRIDDHLETMLGEVNEVAASLATMEDDQKEQISEDIQGRLDNVFGPLLEKSEAIIDPLSKGAIALNRMLRLANLLPGVDLPPIAEKLDPISERLAELAEKIDDLQEAIDSVDFDGSRVLAAVLAIAEKIGGVEGEVSRYEAGMQLTLAASAALREKVPGWVDVFSIAISALAVLMGAGQVSLFIHARKWFKEAV